MKLSKPDSESGFSLVMVMVLVGTAILFLSGALQWSSAGTGLTERNNDYYTAMAAGEAATEKVIAQMSKDFQEGGHRQVESNWNAGYYQTLVPTTGESLDWGNFEFTDTNGVSGRLTVEQVEKGFGPLNWKYNGFTGTTSTYRIISRARLTGWGSGAVGTVKQEIQVAEIPLFEFGAFYNLPMEVDYSKQDLTLNGPVHSNTNAYFGPSVDLTFVDDVTSAGGIFLERLSTGVPLALLAGRVNYMAASDANVLSLNLPLGTNNTPELLHEIIEIPPLAEPPQSLLGQQRFYNKADLIILVEDTGAKALSGYTNGFQLLDFDTLIRPFVRTDAKMWDARQQKTFRLTEIDIADLLANYSAIRDKIATDPRIIYIADRRSTSIGSDAAGVRIINAQALPRGGGLTLATMNPLYVKGDFNTDFPPEPAALVCDALTVVSANWDDKDLLDRLPVVGPVLSPILSPVLSGLGLFPAKSGGTTLNAAVITGIVQTGGGAYSGSMENVITMLEDWQTAEFSFNGSLAVLYRSKVAIKPYNTSLGFSLAPLLKLITFDSNFKPRQAADMKNKLPPGTPQLRTLIRSEWSVAQAN
jgi:hypothetical protein